MYQSSDKLYIDDKMQLNLTLSTLLISDSLDMRASYLLRYRFNALAGERFGRFSGGLTKKNW